MIDRSYLTLCTSDSYVLGVCVLSAALRRTGSVFPLYCLISKDKEQLSMASLILLLHHVDGLIYIDTVETHIDNMDILRGVMKRPELYAALSKIQVWKLDGSQSHLFLPSPFSAFSKEHQSTMIEGLPACESRTLTAQDQSVPVTLYKPCLSFRRCVYLDADLLIIKNIDHLLTDKLYEDAFAAVPDIGWPDSFNSGLFVFKPDHQVFNDLEKLAQDPNASFDGKILIFCFK